jgi:hypothetical protein
MRGAERYFSFKTTSPGISFLMVSEVFELKTSSQTSQHISSPTIRASSDVSKPTTVPDSLNEWLIDTMRA